MPITATAHRRTTPTAAIAAFEFLRRTPRPPMPDRHEHFAGRAAYCERVVRGRTPAHAVAVLTAAYDLALFELDGVQDTAFAHNRAFFARAHAEEPWDAVETMAAYVAEVESGRIPGTSPPQGQDGAFLPAKRSAPWSEWRTAAEAARVPLITVVPVRIVQDQNGRTVVETV